MSTVFLILVLAGFHDSGAAARVAAFVHGELLLTDGRSTGIYSLQVRGSAG